jgi:hypothetical protein
LTETSVCRSFSLPGRRHRARLPMCRNYACKPLRKRIITARAKIITASCTQRNSTEANVQQVYCLHNAQVFIIQSLQPCHPSFSNHHNPVTRPFQTITTLSPILFKPLYSCKSVGGTKHVGVGSTNIRGHLACTVLHFTVAD